MINPARETAIVDIDFLCQSSNGMVLHIIKYQIILFQIFSASVNVLSPFFNHNSCKFNISSTSKTLSCIFDGILVSYL
ncbi:MAG: hypothetical protein LBQ24_04170 [Candidatus Peribacteria bacterium]|nr:hypothetical protein [Candidatus Peribacteria bacterium]